MLEQLNDLYKQVKKIENTNLTNQFLKLIIDYDIDTLKYIFYQAHSFIFDEQKYILQLTRAFQDKFRKELTNLYTNCIITNVSIFEACHIVPFSDSNYENKYDKYNGILLKPDLHNLFDKHIFSINPELLVIEFNREFLKIKANKEEYSRFDNLKLNIKNNETLKSNLHKHYSIFKNNEYRRII